METFDAPTPLVSVIVPVRNSGARVRRLLELLERQTLPREAFEVIVVDDASTDDTAAAASSSAIAHPVVLPGHGGPYVARNAGAAAARGGVLAFTDVDCDPDPRWLENGLAALERTQADLAAGRIDMPLAERPTAVALVDYIRSFDQESSASRGFAATANLFVRRAAFDAVGGFNARMLAGGDREFGQRAVARGATIAYADDAVVSHGPRNRPRQLARKAFRIGFGLAQQLRHAEATDRAQPWTRPGYYVPHRHLAGIDRLRHSGRQVPAGRLATMHVASYLCFQLPLVAGNLSGTLAERASLRAARRVK
jgi:glycosyltransferase involved in cell wall biosynthesis